MICNKKNKKLITYDGKIGNIYPIKYNIMGYRIEPSHFDTVTYATSKIRHPNR